MEADQFISSYQPRMTQYCPVIIDRNGGIHECTNGHLNTMIEMNGDPELLSKLPKNAAPLFWLCDHLHAIVVDYENQVHSGELTREQRIAMDKLAAAGLIQQHLMNIRGKSVI